MVKEYVLSSRKIGNKTFLSNILLEGLPNATREVNKQTNNQRHLYLKGRGKVFLLTYDMIMYIENPRNLPSNSSC